MRAVVAHKTRRKRRYLRVLYAVVRLLQVHSSSGVFEHAMTESLPSDRTKTEPNGVSIGINERRLCWSVALARDALQKTHLQRPRATREGRDGSKTSTRRWKKSRRSGRFRAAIRSGSADTLDVAA